MRSILYLNTEKVTHMVQILNREFYSEMNKQLSYIKKIITCDKNIININHNIDANS
jgi:hypothetical protein